MKRGRLIVLALALKALLLTALLACGASVALLAPPVLSGPCWLRADFPVLELGIVATVRAHYAVCPDPIPAGWSRDG